MSKARDPARSARDRGRRGPTSPTELYEHDPDQLALLGEQHPPTVREGDSHPSTLPAEKPLLAGGEYQ